jgi:hypothetical protein
MTAAQKTTVAELIEAINARMLELELVDCGEPSSGFADERFNGLVECYLQIRPEVLAVLIEQGATIKELQQNYEWSQDTPFLHYDQEKETDDAVFWTDMAPPADKPVLTNYVIDPAKTDMMMAWLNARRDKVYTDAERAENLQDIKDGI